MQYRIDFPRASRTSDAVHIMQVPVISTSHITKADGDQLAKNDPRDSLATLYDDQGHIITWDDWEADDEATAESFIADFPPDLFSNEFRAVVATFARLGYCYLRLDCDGAAIEGLPVFEW